jgi:hypothetical protein
MNLLTYHHQKMKSIFAAILLIASFVTSVAASFYDSQYRKDLEEQRAKYDYKKIKSITNVNVFIKKTDKNTAVVMVSGQSTVKVRDPWLFPSSWDLKDGVLELELVAIKESESSMLKENQSVEASFRIDQLPADLKEIKVIGESNHKSFTFKQQ